MSEYVELAYAAATSRLCYLPGLAFQRQSRTVNSTWKELLKKFAAKFTMPKKLEDTLFPDDKPPALN